MCCVAKIYTSMLNRRLQTFLEKNDLLSDNQNGFRKARSCIDHIFVMCTVLRNRKALKKETFLCFIDFQKAFDSVDRNLLMHKLANIGLDGSMYKSILSLYSNPRSRVILQGHHTEYFDCTIGVKQGDSLSPTLFAIFINDLAQEIESSGIGVPLELLDTNSSIVETMILGILLYADDIVLFAPDEECLQSLLSIVELWCQKYRLDVNLSKTNILHVRAKQKPQSKYVFLFNKRPVPYCLVYKYLGCYFNEFMDYSYTAKMQADSAGRALSALISKMIKNKGFSYNVYSMLYQACVCSISLYGSEIFGYERYDSLFNLHVRAIRGFLGLPKNTASYGLVSEVDWLLPQYQAHVKMVQHFKRILCTENHRLLKRVYLWDYNLKTIKNIRTWCSEVESILNEHNLGRIFEVQQVFPHDTILRLKSSLNAKQQNLLENECLNKVKLRTFNKIKDFTKLAPYISKPLSFIERKTMNKLRLGILPLRIETARFLRPIIPEEQRVCFCNSKDVESELHFMFICSKYNSLREAWLQKLDLPADFENLTQIEKMNIVINEPENVKPTAKYLVAALDLRSTVNKDY